MDDFERCKPWLEAALEYTGGAYTIDDVRDAIASGKQSLIAGEHCAMVVEHIHYPRLSALHVFLAGGDLEELESIIPKLAALASAIGASRVSLVGRDGWARELKKFGFKPYARLVVMEIGKNG